MNKPNCYDCKWRRDLPGDCHSGCAHPDVTKAAGTDDPILAVVTMGSKLGPLVQKMGIRANAHGVRSGWFFWPSNFDPVWLESCNGFEKKEVAPCKSETS